MVSYSIRNRTFAHQMNMKTTKQLVTSRHFPLNIAGGMWVYRFIMKTSSSGRRLFLPLLSARLAATTSTSLARFILVTMVILSTFSGTRAPAQVQSTLFLEPGGVLNGQSINTSSPWITVSPGQGITGTVNVQSTVDPSYSGDVTPLAYTVTWGDRTTQAVLVNSWIATGVNNYGVSINKVAPLQPGTYYIPIAFSYQFTADQVMSATSWNIANNPVWNDGNDLGWDWTDAQYQQALQFGYETQPLLGPIGQDAVGTSGQYTIVNFPATWVGVDVVPEPSTMALILFGGVLFFRKARQS